MTRVRAGHDRPTPRRAWLRRAWLRRSGVGRAAVVASLFALVLGASVTGSDQAVAAPSQPVTIWLAGDSTMANGSGAGVVGWGREFGSYFSNATVVNSAVGARSVQTWLYEGNVSSTMGSNGECTLTGTAYSSRWQAMLNGMKSGDYLIVQFGINDGDRTCPRHVGTARFQSLVTMMARAAQARGAHPILLTSLASITCSGSTAVGNRGFLTQTRAAGTATGAPVIDLHALSVKLYNSLKLCPNNGNYSQGAVGEFFADDHTHTSAFGANQIAGVVAKDLAAQGIPLASWLKTAPAATSTPPVSTTTTSPRTTTVPPNSTSTSGSRPGTTSPVTGSGRLVTSGGKCLDVIGTAAGSNARIDTCNSGSGQTWQFASDGTLRTLSGSMCLDANARGTANGTALIIYGCNGGTNQQFARGANSSILGAQSGRCVDVPNGSNADGTHVRLYDCNGADAQRWTLQTSDNPPTTATGTTTPQQTTTSDPRPTTTQGGSGSCSATYTTAGSWQGGFQGAVKITAGSQAISTWTVRLTLGNGQTITQAWGAKVSQSGSGTTATPESYNASLSAGTSTTFGFIASSTTTNTPPSVTCT